MATTIPKKLYVTIQYRKDASTESGLLGFASPYTKDAAWRKRKNTQDHWAYGYGVQVNVDEYDDSISIENTGSGASQHGRTAPTSAELFITKCYPQIVDNEPMEGFEIAKSVRRSGGWSGGGNVVWRLADPRGFELEISSGNFANIVNCTTIVNGVIQGKCVWGREGKDNILLPESSEPYIEAATLQSKIDDKISLRDVKIGDTVELLNGNQSTMEYLGLLYYVETERYRYYSRNDSEVATPLFEPKASKHFFKKTDGSFYAFSSPKIAQIVSRSDTVRTKTDSVALINDALKDQNRRVDNVGIVQFVSATKIDADKVGVSLEPIEFTPVADETGIVVFPKLNGDTIPIVTKIGDNTWICYNDSGTYNYKIGGYDAKEARLKKLDQKSLLAGQVRISLTVQVSNNSYYRTSSYVPVTMPLEGADTKALEFSRIALTFNGEKYLINSIGSI